MVQYQLREENVDYYPRSFEDAFICINGEFVKNNEFTSLKNKKLSQKFILRQQYFITLFLTKKTS